MYKMKKKSVKIIVFIALLFIYSCVSTQMVTKSPQEIKMMTTKQFETNKNIVFKSAISLLQSESYLIEYADESVGLIRANKRIENKNAKKQLYWNGKAIDASTSKVSFYIEEYNSGLCEVKITLYEGEESTIAGSYGRTYKDTKESMIYEHQIYNQWFNNLRAEIARRKALTN